MTDRELLELAAKAAGLTVHEACDDHLWIVIASGVHTDQDAILLWSPLTDGGAAFRLAVRLGIAHRRFGNTAIAWADETEEFKEPCGTDPCAATYRAIVRAAAQIGREASHD